MNGTDPNAHQSSVSRGQRGPRVPRCGRHPRACAGNARARRGANIGFRWNKGWIRARSAVRCVYDE
ncbi:hypothetical protein BBSC_1672 [Bifidobacterium scardovii JCM 12489 = DSM 13734]|nr:hypothetical protein BBSC_1672 [Bifidobacterium scardovii JCM 12489 = DSM 13734]